MMDDLLKIAVVGTSRAPEGLPVPGTAIGRAIADLDALSIERRLLLATGADALHQRAGVRPISLPESSERAEDEIWEFASDGVALLLGELLQGQSDRVLPEALERLRDAHLLIPPSVLPAALDVGSRNTALRTHVLDVIGKRGLWLARQNNHWSWATTRSDDELLSNAETIWQEATQAERLTALRVVRSKEPERARTMLESTWQHDRAPFRAEAIELLSIKLSSNDQAFLEAALNDRAKDVRERAEALLVRLPRSDVAREAVLRADGLIGKRLGLQIVIHPPDDSLVPAGVSVAAFMTQLIGRVPPSRWVTKLGRQADELVTSLGRDGDWGFCVLAGLTEATLTFTDSTWAAALVPYWLTVTALQFGKAEKLYAGQLEAAVVQYLQRLLRLIPPADAERAVANNIDQLIASPRTAAALKYLARPWSAEFADRYLDAFRSLVGQAQREASESGQVANLPAMSFPTAALAIPLARIPQALDLLRTLMEMPWPDGAVAQEERLNLVLQSYVDTLQLRQRISEEIRG